MFTNRIEFVMPAIISMKFNEVNAKNYSYQPRINMNAGNRNAIPVETKIIVIKQTAITNSKDSADASSSSEAYKQFISQSTTQVLRAPPQLPSDDEYDQVQKHQEQGQQSSIRKLYTAMKQQQSVECEQPDFLYQSNRGEKSVQEPMKPNQIISKEDEQLESETLKSNSLFDLLYKQIPVKGMVECLVKLSSSFFSMEKRIQLYLVKQKKLLLSAKKSRLGLSSQYDVTTSMKDSIASFISNQSRTEYKYLKKLLHQKEEEVSQKQEQTKATYNSSIIKLKQVKVELSSLESNERSYIVFQPNMLGTKQERIKIIRPRTKVGKSIRFSDIKATYQNFQYDRLEIFQNKMAEKNHKGELVLDFKTSNIMESAKNVLIEDQYGRVCLAFYKRKQNLYMLSVMSPFNIMEGFFIAVSNIDHLFF